jgi:hypothetical protein
MISYSKDVFKYTSKIQFIIEILIRDYNQKKASLGLLFLICI